MKFQAWSRYTDRDRSRDNTGSKTRHWLIANQSDRPRGANFKNCLPEKFAQWISLLPAKLSYKAYAFWLVVCFLLLSKIVDLAALRNWPLESPEKLIKTLTYGKIGAHLTLLFWFWYAVKSKINEYYKSVTKQFKSYLNRSRTWSFAWWKYSRSKVCGSTM